MTSPESARNHFSGYMRCGFAYTSPYEFSPGQPTPGITYPPASLHCYPHQTGSPPKGLSKFELGFTVFGRYWNINQLCIDYACRPRLSSRLTLGGLALPRNPWTISGEVSHPSFATHASILTRANSTEASAPASPSARRSPTTLHKVESAASAPDLSPVTLSARNHSTSELLRTL